MKSDTTLEICVDSVESAIAAERGGAGRVELCSDLVEGGVTPSAGLIAAVRRAVSIELSVLVRPRAGDFFYSEDELGVMRRDIVMARQLGANGVTIGILDLHGNIDSIRTSELIRDAEPLKVTFHRAFDMSRDLPNSLRVLESAGVERVLTSGGKRTALEGVEVLQQLCEASAKIRVVAAGGVRVANAAAIIKRSGVREIHAGLRSRVASPMEYRNEQICFGMVPDNEYRRFVVKEEDVRRAVEAANGR